MGNEGAVAHVSLFYVVSRLNTNELGHEAVHQVGIILRFVCLAVREQSQFHKFRVGHVV